MLQRFLRASYSLQGKASGCRFGPCESTQDSWLDERRGISLPIDRPTHQTDVLVPRARRKALSIAAEDDS